MKNNIYPPSGTLISRIINGYSDMVVERINQNWDAYLLSIMYREVRGPRNAVISRMRQEAERAYKIGRARL